MRRHPVVPVAPAEAATIEVHFDFPWRPSPLNRRTGIRSEGGIPTFVGPRLTTTPAETEQRLAREIALR